MFHCLWHINEYGGDVVRDCSTSRTKLAFVALLLPLAQNVITLGSPRSEVITMDRNSRYHNLRSVGVLTVIFGLSIQIYVDRVIAS